MNFFENQDKARKNTFWLVLYFLLAIFLIILALDLVMVGVMIYLYPNNYYVHTYQGYILHQDAIITLIIQSALFISPVVILIIFFGTLLRMFSLREGGIAVAKMVNATPISPDTTDFLEKRFINIVEEMSIASGVRIPKLYVMEESAINAFVAGIKPDDTVMVVTKGALQQLSRDELQGVIGHEFSHIFNSDMQISVKLMGILGGLLLLGQLGYFLLRIFSRTSTRKSSSSEKSGGSIVIAILIIGAGLLVIGYIGLFFGRLIKAGVSRQRELLADASSIQYTRNPQGLIFALRRIKQSEKGAYLDTKNVEDISHLCFSTPRWLLFSDLLATHPPLDRRIQLLDPQGQYANLPLIDPKEDDKKKDPSKSNQAFLMGAAVASGVILTPVLLKKSIGNLTSDNIALAQQLLEQIPQPLKTLAHDPTKVALLLYAMVLSHHEDNVVNISQLLSKELNEEDLSEVVNTSKLIQTLPKHIQLPLLDIAIPAYKANSIDVRKKIYHNIEILITPTEKKLFQITLLTLIGKATEDPLPRENKVKYTGFNSVIPEISLLISMLIKTQTTDDAKAAREFENLMKNFTPDNIQLFQSGVTFTKFEAALKTLNLLSPLCKEKLIHVILECVTQDNVINLSEAELARVIAASLDCPIAPLVANANAY